MVRAKFSVWSKSTDEHGDTQLHLGAVVDGSEENAAFFKLTPAGHISLNTINDKAADEFEIGDEFYVDFTKCEK